MKINARFGRCTLYDLLLQLSPYASLRLEFLGKPAYATDVYDTRVQICMKFKYTSHLRGSSVTLQMHRGQVSVQQSRTQQSCLSDGNVQQRGSQDQRRAGGREFLVSSWQSSTVETRFSYGKGSMIIMSFLSGKQHCIQRGGNYCNANGSSIAMQMGGVLQYRSGAW